MAVDPYHYIPLNAGNVGFIVPAVRFCMTCR
jgi:hypothetical protein